MALPPGFGLSTVGSLCGEADSGPFFRCSPLTARFLLLYLFCLANSLLSPLEILVEFSFLSIQARLVDLLIFIAWKFEDVSFSRVPKFLARRKPTLPRASVWVSVIVEKFCSHVADF